MSDSEGEFYNIEPIRIEGPGLGQNRKSFNKFVDLDLARQVHTGLDPDRPGDESYVNAFDIRNQMRMALREQMSATKQVTLGEIFLLLMQENRFDYKDLVNPQQTIKYNAHLPGIQKTVCSLLGLKELKKLNATASPGKSCKSSSNAGKKQAETTGSVNQQQTPKKLRITMTSVHQAFVGSGGGREDTSRTPRAGNKDTKPQEGAKKTEAAPLPSKNKNVNQKVHWKKETVSVTTTAPQVPLDFDQQLLKILKQQELSQEFPRRQVHNKANENFIEAFRTEPEIVRLSQGAEPKEDALFSNASLGKKDASGISEKGFRSPLARRGSAGQCGATKGTKTQQDAKRAGLKQFVSQPSKVLSIMTSSQTATNAAPGGVPRKLKQQIAEKMKEMRKYLREQEFFENIKHADIQKNLDFLLETVKSDDKFGEKLADYKKADEAEQDDLAKIEKAVHKMNQRMLDASASGSLDLVNSIHQPAERSERDGSQKRLNPSASECQIEVRALRDGYRELVTKLNEMSQDNLSYFHQEFQRIRQQTKPQTQRPPQISNSEGLEESRTLAGGRTRSPGMTPGAASPGRGRRSLALVEELPDGAQPTPSKSDSSEDNYDPNLPFKNKNLNKKLTTRLVAKLQPPILSPTILYRDQSESRNHPLKEQNEAQDLNDYVCFEQEMDQKAKHTQSLNRMPPELYEELHGEMSSAEKKALLARGVILPDQVTVEETNSLGHTTSMSDGMGSLTNSSASQVDPHEQAQLEKKLTAARPKNYMKPTFKHLKLFEHNKLRNMKAKVNKIKVQNQAESHLANGDYGKVIPPQKLHMTVSNRRSTIPASNKTGGSAEHSDEEFTDLKSKYLTPSNLSRSLVQKTKQGNVGYTPTKVQQQDSALQTPRMLSNNERKALQLRKLKGPAAKFEAAQRGQSPELRALFTRLGRPTPQRQQAVSAYNTATSFYPSKSVFSGSESRGVTRDTYTSLVPDLQQKPAIFTKYDPVAFYVSQAKQQRTLIHKRISEEAYQQRASRPSHYPPSDGGPAFDQTLRSHQITSVGKERNGEYYRTTSNFPTFAKGAHRFSCVSPPACKPIAPVASPLTPAEGKKEREGRTSAAVESIETKPTWSSQYQRLQHQNPNLYQY